MTRSEAVGLDKRCRKTGWSRKTELSFIFRYVVLYCNYTLLFPCSLFHITLWLLFNTAFITALGIKVLDFKIFQNFKLPVVFVLYLFYVIHTFCFILLLIWLSLHKICIILKFDESCQSWMLWCLHTCLWYIINKKNW